MRALKIVTILCALITSLNTRNKLDDDDKRLASFALADRVL